MTALGPLRMCLRWLLLSQLAVGLLVQPVLGMASELHVHAHRAAAAHGPGAAAPAPERGIGAALHRLHQLALCCSQAAQPPEILLTVANIGSLGQRCKPKRARIRTRTRSRRFGPRSQGDVRRQRQPSQSIEVAGGDGRYIAMVRCQWSIGGDCVLLERRWSGWANARGLPVWRGCGDCADRDRPHAARRARRPPPGRNRGSACSIT